MDWEREKKEYVLKEKDNNLSINCDGLCKKRTNISDLKVIELGKNNKIFICKECIN